MSLSADGLVATQHTPGSHTLVTGGSTMTEGCHYWEVELTASGDPSGSCACLLGVVRPGLDHLGSSHAGTSNAWYIAAVGGGLFGNGKAYADKQGRFEVGDRIGMLLDLDAGWLRFYRNGRRCGPGFEKGVTGPLVRGVEMVVRGSAVTALPAAEAPPGSGDADEPWAGAVVVAAVAPAPLAKPKPLVVKVAGAPAPVVAAVAALAKAEVTGASLQDRHQPEDAPALSQLETFTAFLQQLQFTPAQLAEYLPALAGAGYDLEGDLEDVTVEELVEEAGMKKPHAKRITKHFAR